MDASRYFDAMHNAMSSRLPGAQLLAAVRLQGEINLFYRARVVTPGRFVVPPVYAEDMYRPDTYGLAEGDGSLTVIDGKEKAAP